MTDQEEARERAARALADRIARIVPASLLADPLAFARAYWGDAAAEGWRWVPKTVTVPLPPGHVPPRPDTYKRGAAAARAALERTDDHA